MTHSKHSDMLVLYNNNNAWQSQKNLGIISDHYNKFMAESEKSEITLSKYICFVYRVSILRYQNNICLADRITFLRSQCNKFMAESQSIRSEHNKFMVTFEKSETVKEAQCVKYDADIDWPDI